MFGLTYEEKKKQREELLNATVKDLTNFKEVFKECLSYNNYVVLGNADSIDKSKLEFDKIIEL
jgi:Zn-dependent M16 (insulinase) family peptidase